MQHNLSQLVLNANPLTELSDLIRYLKNLKVLGIAHSKIQELPPQIATLNLKQIVVENTPLKVPKLVCAERGFEAIKEFFKEQKQVNQDNLHSLEAELDTAKTERELTLAKSLFEYEESED